MSKVWVVELAHQDIDDTNWEIVHVASSEELADKFVAKQAFWNKGYLFVTEYVVDEGNTE